MASILAVDFNTLGWFCFFLFLQTIGFCVRFFDLRPLPSPSRPMVPPFAQLLLPFRPGAPLPPRRSRLCLLFRGLISCFLGTAAGVCTLLRANVAEPTPVAANLAAFIGLCMALFGAGVAREAALSITRTPNAEPNAEPSAELNAPRCAVLSGRRPPPVCCSCCCCPLMGAVVVLLQLLLVNQSMGAAAAARNFPPGRLVTVNGRAMHLHCTGRRQTATDPLVLLFHGYGGQALDWAYVQPYVLRTLSCMASASSLCIHTPDLLRIPLALFPYALSPPLYLPPPPFCP